MANAKVSKRQEINYKNECFHSRTFLKTNSKIMHPSAGSGFGIGTINQLEKNGKSPC
jgi:hypothetical protein